MLFYEKIPYNEITVIHSEEDEKDDFNQIINEEDSS
jgi:hypothetical protein